MKRMLGMALPLAASGILLAAWSGGAAAQGTEFNLSCRANEVLAGIRGRQGWWMDGIAARCRTVQSDGTLSSAIRTTAYRGGNGGTLRTFDCSRNEVMVGYSGSQGSNGYVRYVHEVICAPWQVATKTAGTPHRTINAFERKSGSGRWFADSCFEGRVGTRLRGRAGMYLDRLTDLGCSYALGATPPSRPVVQRPPPPARPITTAPAPIGPSGSYNVALCPEPENPRFSWRNVPGAGAYIVEYRNETRNRTRIQRVSSTSTRPPAMFRKGDRYRWRVRAMNSLGDGPWSGYLSFTGVEGNSASRCLSSGRQQYF